MHLFECPYQSIAHRVAWQFKDSSEREYKDILYPCNSYRCKRKGKCDEIECVCVTTTHFGNNIKNIKEKDIDKKIIVVDYYEKWDIERELPCNENKRKKMIDCGDT